MNSRKKHKGNATRSAGKQATGNRNKHLLAAEHRRTDEPLGRLNKQNPVSPQKMNSINKSDEPSKNAGKYEAELKGLQRAANTIGGLGNKLKDTEQFVLQLRIDMVINELKVIYKKITELQ